jgi:hypothetical protein
MKYRYKSRLDMYISDETFLNTNIIGNKNRQEKKRRLGRSKYRSEDDITMDLTAIRCDSVVLWTR